MRIEQLKFEGSIYYKGERTINTINGLNYFVEYTNPFYNEEDGLVAILENVSDLPIVIKNHFNRSVEDGDIKATVINNNNLIQIKVQLKEDECENAVYYAITGEYLPSPNYLREILKINSIDVAQETRKIIVEC